VNTRPIENAKGHVWAVVLAAGDGTRLASLTTDALGVAIPKQYCSLQGDGSLLHDALVRARSVAPRERCCVVVAATHQRYWRDLPATLPRSNIIVQPRNRGTAHGILLALLHILERDPHARIVFMPADHYVRDEPALALGLSQLASHMQAHQRDLLLLGIEPDELDPELGYIVPGDGTSDAIRPVGQFVEKPSLQRARELLGRGALWNSFIFASHGTSLLDLLRSRMAATVESMAHAVQQAVRLGRNDLLDALYDSIESVDFSRGIVEGAEARLRVLAAAACGWSDLGTPQRVRDTLRRLPEARRERPPFAPMLPALMNLARQNAQLRMSA